MAKKKTFKDIAADIGMIEARANKAMDTIKQIDNMLTVITVKSQDKEIQGIVDTTTKDLTALKKKLSKKLDDYNGEREALVGKEV